MDSIRKWFYKPRRDDQSLLAQFFYADDALNLVAAELDSFDGRKDPERCTLLVNHLRQCQDKVLTICNKIMDELIPDERADRDFRVKFPDDVMQDSLAGQLWFGAECLAAGSSIMNREMESGAMRPLAKALTKALENVRNLLREASLRANVVLPANDLSHDRLVESLKMFDRLLAQFELCYVSAMVPVKSVHEYELQQCVIVLFSETLNRALQRGLLDHEQVDQYDPALMFTIPRLAIVAGLLVFPEGPLSLDDNPQQMSEMFRPFRTLLVKIRELLWTLSESELLKLEKMLCSSEELLQTSLSDVDMSEADETSEECAGETSECETVLERRVVQKERTGAASSAATTTAPQSEKDSQRSATILTSNDVCIFSTDDDDDGSRALKGEPSAGVAKEEEDSNSFNSCLDSGLGTMQSNSEPESLSDRSPDNIVAKTAMIEDLVADSCGGEVEGEKSSNISREPSLDCDIPPKCCSDAHEIPSRVPESPSSSSSSSYPEDQSASGILSLNGQWMLPVIPCSCSHTTLINEDTNLTHRGLINRGIPLDDGSYFRNDAVTCDECWANNECPVGEGDDVRWGVRSGGECPPGTSDGSERDTVKKSRTSSYCESDGDDSRNIVCGEQRTINIVDTNTTATTGGDLIMQNGSDVGEVTGGVVMDSSNGITNVDKLSICNCGSNNNKVTVNALNHAPVIMDESWNKRNNIKRVSCTSGAVEGGRGGGGGKGAAGEPSAVDLQVRYADNWEALCINSTATSTDCNNSNSNSGCGGVGGGHQLLPSSKHREVASSLSSSCSSCHSTCSVPSDSYSSLSSDTSSFNSDYQDEEEVALAVRAAEAASSEARAKFRSSADLIHRLFVCIAGVADQLQTNFAGDLRNILKSVFLINSSSDKTDTEDDDEEEDEEREEEISGGDCCENGEEALVWGESEIGRAAAGSAEHHHEHRPHHLQPPPPWVPDEDAPLCMACLATFTVVRRRHHCRNCGKVFCARCSSNSVPLPRFGHLKPVRVCNRCFIYQVTPFLIDQIQTSVS